MHKNLQQTMYYYQKMYNQEDFYWWYVAKRKLVQILLKQYLKKKPGLKLIDMGCGTGIVMEEIKPFGEVWGLDFSQEALDFCQQRGHEFLKKANLSLRLPLKSNFFDVVTALDVLEHLEDEKTPLSEFFRILKKRGILILAVPAYKFLWSYWDERVGHRRRYNKQSLSSKLKKEGFLIEKISYYNTFVLPVAAIFRFFKGAFQKKNKVPSCDFIPLPFCLNKFLLFLSQIERFLITKGSLPFGLSLIGVVRKE